MQKHGFNAKIILMKKDIHPKYGKTIVTCSCGNTFETKSTQEKIQVEVCSACHPFYTGKQKIIDSTGRVDLFKRRVAAKKEMIKTKKKPIKKKDESKQKPD